jgi:hypothetical protein
MSLAVRTAIDALDSAGSGLRAIFTRNGDRFDHAIVAVQGVDETPLLFAEGLPLQEVVDHRTFDGRRAMLATGAGGGQYWSISVDPIIDARLAILGFDVACRDSPQTAPPAAHYRLAENLTQDGHRLVLTDGRLFTVTCGVMPVSIATEFIPTCQLETSSGELAFRSNRSPHASTPKMARWRYEFRFVRPL